MTISLDDYEKGEKYTGNYADDLASLQNRLERLQAAMIVGGKQAIIMFEGWDAAGKGSIIQRLCTNWDPRHFEVYPIGAPTEAERERHFLYRFWTKVPGNGEITVFDRSWYGRVAVERVEGFASEREWKRAYDEINEFEAQLCEQGTMLIKLFVHVTQAEQDKRFADRLNDPWKRWKTGKDDYRNRSRRADYLDAYHEMFEKTDTRWAPWTAIDGNNKKSARIAALTTIADRLTGHVSLEPPPVDPEVVAMATAAFGYQPEPAKNYRPDA